MWEEGEKTVDLENTPVAFVYAHFLFVTKKLCYKLLIFLFYIIEE